MSFASILIVTKGCECIDMGFIWFWPIIIRQIDHKTSNINEKINIYKLCTDLSKTSSQNHMLENSCAQNTKGETDKILNICGI